MAGGAVVRKQRPARRFQRQPVGGLDRLNTSRLAQDVNLKRDQNRQGQAEAGDEEGREALAGSQSSTLSGMEDLRYVEYLTRHGLSRIHHQIAVAQAHRKEVEWAGRRAAGNFSLAIE